MPHVKETFPRLKGFTSILLRKGQNLLGFYQHLPSPGTAAGFPLWGPSGGGWGVPRECALRVPCAVPCAVLAPIFGVQNTGAAGQGGGLRRAAAVTSWICTLDEATWMMHSCAQLAPNLAPPLRPHAFEAREALTFATIAYFPVRGVSERCQLPS